MLFQLLRKSASVGGFFLKDYMNELAPYIGEQIKYYKEGKLKGVIDNGERSPSGPFKGLEKISDGVEVRIESSLTRF